MTAGVLIAGVVLALAQWGSAAYAQGQGGNWTSCLTKSEATVARVSATSVRYCGRITDHSLNVLVSALLPTDQELEIMSLGGEREAPIAMAEMVRDRALNVAVIGPCMSGCGSYVFVAGRARRALPGSVIGLHNTNTSAAWLVGNASGKALSARDAPLLARAAREQLLYRSLGVDQRLLIEPQARLNTKCIERNGVDDRTSETKYQIYSQFSMWIPTMQQWRAFGVVLDGAAPRNQKQAQRLLDNAIPSELRTGSIAAYSPFALAAPPEAYLARVSWCR